MFFFVVRFPASALFSLRCSPRGSILVPARVHFGGRLRPAQGPPGSLGESMLGQCYIYFSPFRSPARHHLGTSRASFRELFVHPCFPIFARLASEDAGTSSASSSRWSLFWKTCLVRWFASLFRAVSGLRSLLFSLFLRSHGQARQRIIHYKKQSIILSFFNFHEDGCASKAVPRIIYFETALKQI